jgi:hypothetical protein
MSIECWDFVVYHFLTMLIVVDFGILLRYRVYQSMGPEQLLVNKE